MLIRPRRPSSTIQDTGLAAYIGAIVLGLNDALVELTGALAGFTMVLQDSRLIAMAGLTTGVAATLSMAAAEYLSKDAEDSGTAPFLDALYTGLAYMVTVALLLLPFLITNRPFVALAWCLATAALIIVIFTYFCARFCNRPFKSDCLKMLCLSFAVAAISFALSWLAREWWGIDV